MLSKPLALAVVLLSISLAAAQENWPQFRGPDSVAQAAKGRYPLEWDQKKNVLWRAEVPGHGWSSPVVWGERVFLTAVLNDKTPAPRKGLYIQDLFGKIPPGEHTWKLYCLDLSSGKLLWERILHQGMPSTTIHLKNTYSSETPVTDGERVYAYFGNLGLHCYDLAGNKLWSKDLGAYKTRMGWGTGASPVLCGDLLLVVNDNEEKSFLVALDKKTGAERWKVERDEKSNWATPFVWANQKRTEIVTPGTTKVRSYGIDGKPLWEFGGMSSISIPTPSAGHGLLYVSSGYVLDPRRPVFAIKPGASGDITLKSKEDSNDFIAWRQPQAGPYHPSPLVYGDEIYVLLDRGLLSCYDAKTGKEIYARERIEAGSDKFTASPVAADGKIYCLSEDGDTFVIRAGRKFEVLAKNPLGDMALATPALVRGSLLIRAGAKLYRIGEN